MKLFKFGLTIELDAEDLIKLQQQRLGIQITRHKRRLTKDYLQVYVIKRTKGKMFRQLIHRWIVGLSMEDKSIVIDHIDRNPLNNKKENLRMSNNSLNHHNVGKLRGRFKFKGCRSRKERSWSAETKIRNNYYYIGTFDCENDAALAYDLFNRAIHGKHFLPNLPLISEYEYKICETVKSRINKSNIFDDDEKIAAVDAIGRMAKV